MSLCHLGHDEAGLTVPYTPRADGEAAQGFWALGEVLAVSPSPKSSTGFLEPLRGALRLVSTFFTAMDPRRYSAFQRVSKLALPLSAYVPASTVWANEGFGLRVAQNLERSMRTFLGVVTTLP